MSVSIMRRPGLSGRLVRSLFGAGTSSLESQMQSTGRFTPALRRLVSESYDECRSCGAKLYKETTALAGYDADGAPSYVGPCCAVTIQELASHIYWWWHADRRVPPDTALWRYMDFAKFVSLLEERALFFSRADRLGDPFEGASGISDRQPEWDAHYKHFFREAILTVPGRTETVDEDWLEQEASRLLENFRSANEAERRRAFASCWHANTGESEAIWKLYCPPPAAGVAIRSTVGRLRNSFIGGEAIDVGSVRYIDFRTTFANPYERIFSKRKSLSHETEVRAVINSYPFLGADTGYSVKVDLGILIDAVIPSPFAPDWFAPLVERMLKRFDLAVPTEVSELRSEPFY
jgi:hypothetical protein